MSLTDKKISECVVKIKNYCHNKNGCKSCFMYDQEDFRCMINNPSSWKNPQPEYVVRLTDQQVDAIITALAYKETVLCQKLQELKNDKI